MKLNGTQLGGLATKVVVLPRPAPTPPIELTIQALPLGYERDVLNWLPSPEPPKIIVTKNGRWVKGADGRPLYDIKEDDPGYQKKSRDMSGMQGMAFIWKALQADAHVVWDTDADLFEKDKVGFFGGLHDEMAQAGFASGDVRLLIEAIMQLSNMSDEAVEEAREAFLSEA